ncbi:MAG: FAD-binding oxidoreductase [Flavobacteriales bacterium]|nr:FAD-binding oxidoreductase [Flavobacteriales bacterium]
MRETENLIVGLGIAGINLCHQLEKQGKTFLVIDNCPDNSASLVAGGLFNPIGLKRKIKSWMVDELFEVMVPNYKELEEKLHTRLLHELPILKPISSKEELPEWQSAIDENRISPYVDTLISEPPTGLFQSNVVGSATIHHGGFVNMRSAIFEYRQYVKEKGWLIQDSFDYFAIEESSKGISYKGISADRIIFCEGRFISTNPFFSWVPLKPTKGQMLTVKVSPHLSSEMIYNQQFYMFPTTENNVFRLGATYDWNDLNEEPTEAAKEDLISKVKKALNVEMEVLEHQAAIRPNVHDRRPVLGSHPENPNLILFNGMGSKGVMLAPYFAKELMSHIYEKTPLNPEVDINRFVKKFYEKA